MQSLEELLGEAPALALLPREHLATIAGCAHTHVFAPGTPILRRGEPADEFYVLRRGSISVTIEVPGRGEVTIETLGEGELLGWSWLVPPYRNAFSARALDAAHVVAIDGACLRGKCEADPALGYDLLKVVAMVFVRRLEETRVRALDLYGNVRGAG